MKASYAYINPYQFITEEDNIIKEKGYLVNIYLPDAVSSSEIQEYLKNHFAVEAETREDVLGTEYFPLSQWEEEHSQ